MMKKLVAIAILAVFGVGAAPALEFDELRWGREGDSALALGNYPAAEQLYRRYLNSALVRGDSSSVRSARLRLINLALQRGDEAAATAELAEYRAMLENPDDATLKALNADLLLLRGDLTGAEKALRELSATADLPDYLYNQVLFSLGATLEEEEKFHDAAEVFKLATSKSDDFETAFHYVYSLQKSGDLIGSQEALALLAARSDLTPIQRNAVAVLGIYQAIGEKRFSEARSLFEKLPSPDSPDRWRCAAATLLAEHFRETGRDTPTVAALLNDAFLCAPTTALRKYLLSSLIELLAAESMDAEATAAMEKFITLFPDGDDRFENLIQLAHLLNRTFTTYSGAMGIYRGLIADPAAPLSVKLRAAREGAGVHEQAGDAAGAEAMYDFLIANAVSEADRAEALLLAANHFYKLRNFAESAGRAKLAAAPETEWRFPALFALMKAQEELGDYASALGAARTLKNNGVGEWPRMGAFAEAELLEKSGDRSAAIDAYANFSALWSFSENAPTALYLAGRLAFDGGDYLRASEYFNRLADRYAHYADTPHGLYLATYAEYLLKDFPAMNRTVEKLEYGYRESPYTIGALLWKLDCLKLENRLPEALELADRMLEEFAGSPSSPIARIKFEKAEILALLERPGEALALYGEAAQANVDPELTAKCLVASGRVAMKRGNYAEARKFFRDALAAAPDGGLKRAAAAELANAESAEGLLENDRSKLEAAEARYRELLDGMPPTDPLYLASCYRLGVVCRELGNTADAADCFRRLIEAAHAEAEFSGGGGEWLYVGARNYAETALQNGSAAMLDTALRYVSVVGEEYQATLLPIKQRLTAAFAAAQKPQNGD